MAKQSSPPYIPTDTRHYRYALLVAAGYKHRPACRKLGISPDTARNWRQSLCKTAATFWGRPVSYEFAAIYAVNAAFRALVPPETPEGGADRADALAAAKN